LNPQRANRRRARWQTASPRASAYWASSLNETQLCRCAWSRMTPSLISQIRFYARTRPVKAELFTADRRLIIAGCSYYWPEAYSVAVLPRLYGAAFLSFGLATMDGLEGKTDANCTFGPSVKSRKVPVRWQPEYGAAMSANGTFETCRRTLKMSVNRGRLEVIGTPSH
jgi:hypothetical protein